MKVGRGHYVECTQFYLPLFGLVSIRLFVRLFICLFQFYVATNEFVRMISARNTVAILIETSFKIEIADVCFSEAVAIYVIRKHSVKLS